MTASKDWRALLRDCDFDMAAGEIRDMLEIHRDDASRGEEIVYRDDLGSALTRFVKFPSLETAMALLDVSPSLYSYFEVCKTTGCFYQARRLLYETAVEQPLRTEPTYDELLDRIVGLSAEEPNPPVEVAKFLAHHGWKREETPSHGMEGECWRDPAGMGNWFVWQNAFAVQKERSRSITQTIEQLRRSGIPRLANALQKVSEPSSLTEAFRESARPDAPAPTGWWFWPVFGIVAGLFLLEVSSAAGAICLVVMGVLLGAGMIRARRNRS
jgi:hypothetical protein